jgi:hypothetical protein
MAPSRGTPREAIAYRPQPWQIRGKPRVSGKFRHSSKRDNFFKKVFDSETGDPYIATINGLSRCDG